MGKKFNTEKKEVKPKVQGRHYCNGDFEDNIIKEYEELSNQIKTLNTKKDKIKETLLERFSAFEFVETIHYILDKGIDTKSTTDTKMFKAKYPDIYDQLQKETVMQRFKITDKKE